MILLMAASCNGLTAGVGIDRISTTQVLIEVIGHVRLIRDTRATPTIWTSIRHSIQRITAGVPTAASSGIVFGTSACELIGGSPSSEALVVGWLDV